MMLGAYFPKGLPLPWRVLLTAAEGLPAQPGYLEVFTHHTGRSTWPTSPARELWLKFGRRTWKSTMAAAIGVHQATCVDHKAYLPPGAIGVFMIIADSRDTAAVILNYCVGMLESSPLLKQRIENLTADRIELNNGCAIEVHASNYRRVRGRTLIGCVADEIAFWPSDENSASPDREVLRAVKPSMLTVPSAKLIVTSSPYRPIGAMYETFTKHFGHDELGDDILVATGTSLEMNPTLDAEAIQKMIAEDPEAARSEYLAEWREDISSLYAAEWLQAAIDKGITERAPRTDLFSYYAHADLSGGRRDACGLGISHKDQYGKAVLDYVLEIKPPCDVSQVIERFAREMKRYGVSTVRCDNYAANFATEAFARCGVKALQPVLVDKRLDTSLIFLESVVLFSAGKLLLLDNEHLIRQLSALERRARSGGKDQAGHAPGGHDDLSLAAIGSLLFAWRSPNPTAGPQVVAHFSNIAAPISGVGFADERRFFDGNRASSRNLSDLLGPHFRF